MAISHDVNVAYGLIEGVLRDLLEDGRLSAAAAHEREAALGKLEREKVAVDSDGRVDGIPLDVLATSSVRALCVEFAEDVYLAPIEMDFRLAHSAQGTRISSVTGASRYLDWGLLAILYGSAEQAPGHYRAIVQRIQRSGVGAEIEQMGRYLQSCPRHDRRR